MNKINTKMDQAIAKLANIKILHLSSSFFIYTITYNINILEITKCVKGKTEKSLNKK